MHRKTCENIEGIFSEICDIDRKLNKFDVTCSVILGTVPLVIIGVKPDPLDPPWTYPSRRTFNAFSSGIEPCLSSGFLLAFIFALAESNDDVGG